MDAESTNTSAGVILRLLGQRELDWVNLYRILDYVAYECGDKRGIVKAHLATGDEIDRFAVVVLNNVPKHPEIPFLFRRQVARLRVGVPHFKQTARVGHGVQPFIGHGDAGDSAAGPPAGSVRR